MRVLLDTHLLLWAAGLPNLLPDRARAVIEDPETELVFSAASIWEVVIKSGLGREDFNVDAAGLRRGLLFNGYGELAIRGEHALAVATLPSLHSDPFDRMLLAQAGVERLQLFTADSQLAAYPGDVVLV